MSVLTGEPCYKYIFCSSALGEKLLARERGDEISLFFGDKATPVVVRAADHECRVTFLTFSVDGASLLFCTQMASKEMTSARIFGRFDRLKDPMTLKNPGQSSNDSKPINWIEYFEEMNIMADENTESEDDLNEDH